MTLRVLVIDNEPAAGASFRDLLGRAGYESVWLERGEEALQLVQRVFFDVVVSEIDLDGINGVELCRRLAASKPSLPVVIRTESATLAGAVESLRAGARDFLSKGDADDIVLGALTRVVATPDHKSSPAPTGDIGALCSMDEIERQHVALVLEAVGGNKREAARILKLDRTTLYRKLKRYGIASPRRAPSSSQTFARVNPEDVIVEPGRAVS